MKMLAYFYYFSVYYITSLHISNCLEKLSDSRAVSSSILIHQFDWALSCPDEALPAFTVKI